MEPKELANVTADGKHLFSVITTIGTSKSCRCIFGGFLRKSHRLVLCMSAYAYQEGYFVSSGRVEHFDTSLCAALVAEACNIGIEAVGRQDVPALRRERLAWVSQDFIRPETIAAASARIVSAHAALPLVKIWGAGDVASADGMRFTERWLGKFGFIRPSASGPGEMRAQQPQSSTAKPRRGLKRGVYARPVWL